MNHADRVCLGTLIGLSAIDVYLAKNGHSVITDTLRRNRVVFVLGTAVLTAHVLDILGPVDPFKHAGRMLSRYGAVPDLVPQILAGTLDTGPVGGDG